MGKQVGQNNQGAWASGEIWAQIFLLISEESHNPASFQVFSDLLLLYVGAELSGWCSCSTSATEHVLWLFLSCSTDVTTPYTSSSYILLGGSTILSWVRCLWFLNPRKSKELTGTNKDWTKWSHKTPLKPVFVTAERHRLLSCLTLHDLVLETEGQRFGLQLFVVMNALFYIPEPEFTHW